MGKPPLKSVEFGGAPDGEPTGAAAASLDSVSAGRGRSYRRDPGARAAVEGRIPELDGLRGVACLAILAYHLKPGFVPFGWAAVDLFFVLSGYLITAILIRHPASPRFLASFYARRGLRIWPIYYLTILAVVVLGPLLPVPTRWDGLLSYLTYTQNLPMYWSGRVPPFSPYVAHLWTLANEEQFYLIWPLLVCLFGRRWIIPLAVGLAATSVAARGLGLNTWLLLPRADGFALGGLLAALLADRARVVERLGTYRRAFTITTALALAYLAVVVARGWLPTVGRPPRGSAFSVLGISLTFLGIVGLVAIHAGRPALAWLRRPRLVYLGTISYGLYMYHFILLMLGGDVIRTRWGARSQVIDLALMTAAFVLAMLSWRWIEKPLLGLKTRFPYDGGRAVPIDGSTRTPEPVGAEAV